MKKLLFVISMMFALTTSALTHHPVYHPIRPISHPHLYHHSGSSKPIRTSHRPPVKANVVHHTTPPVKAYYRENLAGKMVLYFMIANSINHHRHEGIDYVRCPVCHRTFIVKGRRCCTACSRR